MIPVRLKKMQESVLNEQDEPAACFISQTFSWEYPLIYKADTFNLINNLIIFESLWDKEGSKYG